MERVKFIKSITHSQYVAPQRHLWQKTFLQCREKSNQNHVKKQRKNAGDCSKAIEKKNGDS